MLLVDEKKLDTMLKEKYDKGVADGIKTGIRLMEERILLACENGNHLILKARHTLLSRIFKIFVILWTIWR